MKDSTETPLYDELVKDRNFRALLRRVEREYVTWNEFLNLPLPQNMSPARTWEVLRETSHSIGINLDIPDLEGREYWYRRTYQLTDLANRIARDCSKDSRLYRILTSTAGEPFQMKMRIAETTASARLDGFDITEADACILIRYDKVPKNDAERLVANAYRANECLIELIDEPFSQELFLYLRDLLLEGVDVDAFESVPLSSGLVRRDYSDEEVHRFSGRQLDYIAAYANHEIGEEWDLPLLRANLITDCMRFYRPLGNVSGQVGCLATRFYALKHDMPLLGMLPVSKAKIDWENGLIKPPAVICDLAEFDSAQNNSPGDLTLYETIAVQLTRQTITETKDRIEAWEHQDVKMREILKQDADLNQRQRAILARALRSPKAEFKIRYHQTNHKIAYTTARRDLLELEEKGYLSMERRGKTFVFIPTMTLQRLSKSSRKHNE